MKIKGFIIFSLFLFLSILAFNSVFAEDKIYSGGMIPKLPKTPNDPELSNGHVYPNWGPPCQRYTYSVIYRDKEGREPEYMKIYFNGKMIDLNKTNPNDNNYKNGVRYEYKYVPNKIDSNFYYFEASNGVGKARASIIDSPDNGPVLFTSAFDKNEIAVVDKYSGKKILSFSTGKEWIGGIALSDDGKYLAAKASKHIYLFDITKAKEPLWSFDCEQCRIGDDVKGGIDISGDGSKIIAAFGERIALFDKSSNKPVWIYKEAGNSYKVAISKDGNYMAAATAGDESNLNSNLIILWSKKSEKPLWQYHASGNFHDVSLSDNGDFITGSTGCPDRRFYLFSQDSNKPLIKSDPLTRDSPVHRAKISADGAFIAVGSEADAGAVFLFAKDGGQVWKFPTLQGSSVRALNLTPSGRYIGAATFDGDAYIFEKDRNNPIAGWKVNASLGGIDIADDGSFLAAGGTDKILYIFERDTKTKTEVSFSEYIEEVDISGNGKYVAAGTGGSAYFFETYISQDRGKTFDCSKVTEPVSESQMMREAGYSESGEQVISSPCGDGKCEGPETIENCRGDCDPKSKRLERVDKNSQGKFPGMLTGFAFLGSIMGLISYFLIVKFNLLGRKPDVRLKLNKKIIVGTLIAATLFLLSTLVFMVLNKQESVQYEPQENTRPFEKMKNSQRQEESPGGKQAICGNDICEPGLGESKENCPKDCSAQ